MSEKEIMSSGKRFRKAFQVVGYIFWVLIVEALLIPLKNQFIPENIFASWGVGILGIILWGGLYVFPYNEGICNSFMKKIWWFLFLLSPAWIIADWNALILTIGFM